MRESNFKLFFSDSWPFKIALYFMLPIRTGTRLLILVSKIAWDDLKLASMIFPTKTLFFMTGSPTLTPSKEPLLTTNILLKMFSLKIIVLASCEGKLYFSSLTIS